MRRGKDGLVLIFAECAAVQRKARVTRRVRFDREMRIDAFEQAQVLRADDAVQDFAPVGVRLLEKREQIIRRERQQGFVLRREPTQELAEHNAVNLC